MNTTTTINSNGFDVLIHLAVVVTLVSSILIS